MLGEFGWATHDTGLLLAHAPVSVTGKRLRSLEGLGQEARDGLASRKDHHRSHRAGHDDKRRPVARRLIEIAFAKRENPAAMPGFFLLCGNMCATRDCQKLKQRYRLAYSRITRYVLTRRQTVITSALAFCIF